MTDKELEQKVPSRTEAVAGKAPNENIEPATPEVPTPSGETTTEKAGQTAGGEAKPAEDFSVPKKRRPANPVATPTRDEVTSKIEKVLEDGVGEAFSRLSPVAKQEFKMRGEQTAIKIRALLQEKNLQVKKIFRLIWEWLKMLPGVNRFFLEQEAKIKTDKIVSLHQQTDFTK